MMTKMRDLMSLYEAFQSALREAGAGPSRVVQHIRDGNVFIMISAMRGNVPHAENLRRTESLSQMLRALPVSYIETEGEYQEDGQPGPSPEKSFFVMPRKGDAATTAAPFRDWGVKLMNAFDQDSILYGDGTSATLILASGGTIDLGDTVTFRPEVIKTLDGFSKIKGRVFSFTDAPKAREPVAAKPGAEMVPAKTSGVKYGSHSKNLLATLDKGERDASKTA